MNYEQLSRYRAALMGLAMLFVMCFHVPMAKGELMYGVVRLGNIGVDMFLFLSGIGLWFSWTKTILSRTGSLPTGEGGGGGFFFHNWFSFYMRRLKRIYPVWLIIACLYYIPRFDGVHWIDLFGDILINWDFWLHDELTFWYIPATMMLYVFAPPYMELIRRHPIYHWLVLVMVMWCILVQWVTPIHRAVGHIEIFWSRVPIFFLGINMGEMVRQKKSLDGQCIWMVWIMFLMSLCTSIWLEQEIHGKFPLFIERMLYIPLTVTTIILLNRIFRRTPQWFNRSVAWFGALSLEAYLIHIEFVLKPLEKNTDLGYWMTFLITVAVTMPLAWLLHKGVDFLLKLK